MNAEKKIQSAKVSLLLDQCFFGVLALRLKMQPDPSCDTAWTDGRTMGYNPDFVDKLPHEELVGLIAHEVMHCAAGHPWRRDGRDHKKWNVAADHAINNLLKDANFKLPEGGLCDPQYQGKSAEWIYARMPDNPSGGGGGGQGKGPGQGQGKPAPGEVRDAPSDAAADGSTEEEWRAAVAQSAKAAEAMGKLPGCAKRFAGEASAPRVDWRSVLRRFVQEVSNADYSWRAPNRRYLPQGLYLPSLRSEQMGPILIAIDTSGSIDNVTLGQFWAEVTSIVSEAKPRRIHVVYCDARIQGHDEFDSDEPLELRPKGGGGSDARPVWAMLDQLEEQPTCIVYLTDMLLAFPESSDTPTLWATTGVREAPFGEVVLIGE